MAWPWLPDEYVMTPAARVLSELREHVVGASDLEGAGRLHVLALDGERGSDAGAADLDERRPPDDTGDARRRGSYVVERDEPGPITFADGRTWDRRRTTVLTIDSRIATSWKYVPLSPAGP
jgi:hypothetical protein